MVSFKTFATLHDCCAILAVFAESHNLQNMYRGEENQLEKKPSENTEKAFYCFCSCWAIRLSLVCDLLLLLYLQPTRKVDEANGKQTQKKLN